MSLCYRMDVNAADAKDAAVYAASISREAGLCNFIQAQCGVRHVIPELRGFKSTEVFEIADRLGGVSLFAVPTMANSMAEETLATPRSGKTLRPSFVVAPRRTLPICVELMMPSGRGWCTCISLVKA